MRAGGREVLGSGGAIVACAFDFDKKEEEVGARACFAAPGYRKVRRSQIFAREGAILRAEAYEEVVSWCWERACLLEDLAAVCVARGES